MAVDYKTILWNKNKKVYDKLIVAFVLMYLIAFTLITVLLNPGFTPETLIIRGFGSLAIIMLHIILMIGPLARLNTAFLPLLYNRRHLGVSMFLIALIHGVFSIIQFHTLGNTNPIYAIFTSNMDYGSLINFPFQVLGFLALLILYVMAATSHDFWLKNLSAKTWKALHMMVYIAYGLIVMHVFLGAFQQETSLFSIGLIGTGMLAIISLHLISGVKEYKIDKKKVAENEWVHVCHVNDIEDTRAKIFTLDNERVAIYKYDGQLSAVHNVCKHQGGPLGEGKIVDGCITCPWHGYQYYPGNGKSPPPFDDRVATYELKVEDQIIYINPAAFPEGTAINPVKI